MRPSPLSSFSNQKGRRSKALLSTTRDTKTFSSQKNFTKSFKRKQKEKVFCFLKSNLLILRLFYKNFIVLKTVESKAFDKFDFYNKISSDSSTKQLDFFNVLSKIALTGTESKNLFDYKGKSTIIENLTVSTRTKHQEKYNFLNHLNTVSKIYLYKEINSLLDPITSTFIPVVLRTTVQSLHLLNSNEDGRKLRFREVDSPFLEDHFSNQVGAPHQQMSKAKLSTVGGEPTKNVFSELKTVESFAFDTTVFLLLILLKV
jgi:hypothetical protein